MFKTTTFIAIAFAVTFITSTPAKAQLQSRGFEVLKGLAVDAARELDSSKRAYGTYPRISVQPSKPIIRTGGGDPRISCGTSPLMGGATPFRDIRLVGNWSINEEDGSVTTLKFTDTSVSVVRTDDFGDVTQTSHFKWKATTSSATSRNFVFRLKHSDGTIENYQGTLKSDRSKCKLVAESGKTLILQRAPNKSMLSGF